LPEVKGLCPRKVSVIAQSFLNDVEFIVKCASQQELVVHDVVIVNIKRPYLLLHFPKVEI
jgi:hypothetical protein